MMKQRRIAMAFRISPALLLPLALLALALFFPDYAWAGEEDPIGKVLCTIVNWFTGSVGKAVASLAVIVLGIMALFGKLSPGVAITTIVGITIMFNGAEVVNALDLGIAAECPSTMIVPGCEITRVLCSVVGWFDSTTGRVLATIAILMLGFGAAFGKLSPVQSILMIIGITMVLTSAEVLNQIGLSEGSLACSLCGTTPVMMPAALPPGVIVRVP